jgi:hypothetical protein
MKLYTASESAESLFRKQEFMIRSAFDVITSLVRKATEIYTEQKAIDEYNKLFDPSRKDEITTFYLDGEIFSTSTPIYTLENKRKDHLEEYGPQPAIHHSHCLSPYLFLLLSDIRDPEMRYEDIFEIGVAAFSSEELEIISDVGSDDIWRKTTTPDDFPLVFWEALKWWLDNGDLPPRICTTHNDSPSG